MKMSYTGFNLRTFRKEPIQNPRFEAIQTSRGVKYMVKGVGSDGTKMNRFISKEDYDAATGGRALASRSPRSSRSPTRKGSLARTPTRKSSLRSPRSSPRTPRSQYAGQMSPLQPLSPLPSRSQFGYMM